jgi:molybdenum-dependent DNA-binding transcriptional regulator ModE
MNIERIDQIDLNLLRLFAEVYDRGSVSAAAERLGISQPAASNGLRRLRGVLGTGATDRCFAPELRFRPTHVAAALSHSHE